MGAACEAQHRCCGHVDGAGVGAAIAQQQDAGLNINAACVVKGDTNGRRVVSGAAGFAEGAGIVDQRIGAGVGAAKIACSDRSSRITRGDEGGAGAVVDRARANPARLIAEGVVEHDLAGAPSERVVVAESAAAIKAETTGADRGGALKDRGAGAAMVAEGDGAGARDGYGAATGQGAVRLGECADAGIARVDVENTAADVQRRSQARERAVDRRCAA